MKRLKMMLMALVAVLAVGVVGASAASAATGNGEAVVTVGTPCDVGFQWDTGTGNPAPANGQTATLHTFAPSGCSAAINEPPTTLDVTFDSPGTNDVLVNGTISVNVAGFINCTYDVTDIEGEYSEFTNEENEEIVQVTGAGNIVRTGGPFLCPSNEDFEIVADFKV